MAVKTHQNVGISNSLVALRNKIEHRDHPELDPALYGECQATLMNFEERSGLRKSATQSRNSTDCRKSVTALMTTDELTAPHPRQKVVRDVTIHDRRGHTVDLLPIGGSREQP